jgi:hypothetical protein
MSTALAVVTKEESATVALPSLVSLPTSHCQSMDAEVLGEFIEKNWNQAVGNALGLIYLVREMKRRFKMLDRKKQVNGEYLTIRGFTDFKKWFTSFTGKSIRMAYYLLQTEEEKHKRNAERQQPKKIMNPGFAARCNDTKKALAEIQRQVDDALSQQKPVNFKAHESQTNIAVYSVFEEFLKLISPEGCEVSQGDNGKFYITRKREEDEDDEPEPPTCDEDKKAKRSAAAKKAAATRAAKKAAALPTAAPAPAPDEIEDNKAPTKTKSRKKARVAATPQEIEQRRKNAEAWKAQRLAQPMGECEGCNEAPATERVTGTYSVDDYCAKCAADNREYRRKRLVREMGVAKVCGKFWSWKSLPNEPVTADDGKGGTYEIWSKRGYLERLRKKFLGNHEYDQAVVTEYIAELEKKMGALKVGLTKKGEKHGSNR